MLIQQPKKLYLPAISIIAVVIGLLVMIGISTYHNLNRERRMALEYLERHGRMLLLALEAGARSAMTLDGVHEDPIGALLAEFARNEDVAYIYLSDKQGRLVHYAPGEPPDALRPWHPEATDSATVHTRTIEADDGTERFELAKQYAPLFLGGVPLLGVAPNPSQSGLHSHSGDVMVVGFSTEWITTARQSDRRHALFMGSILLLLGAAALFFLFVIQNYYRVNQDLEANRDYIHQIVESMPNGLVSIDTNGAIKTYNQTAASMLAMGGRDLEGRNIEDLFDVAGCGVQSALDHRELLDNCEINYIRPDGKAAVFDLGVAPLGAQPTSSAGAVLIFRDMTEVKALEEKARQHEKLAAVGTLAAGVAHEIRNPLSSIRGFAHYLKHRLKDRPEENEYASVMVREIDRINSVVSNLLTLARPAQIKKTKVSPTALVDHVLTIVSAEAASQGVVLTRGTEGHCRSIMADDSQLTQAMLNLVLNALQALGDAGRIEAGARETESQLILWIEDDGPGIDAANRERMFDPFFTTRSAGTGLGLAIVRQIVSQHEGRIQVHCPAPGKDKGCRIEVLLPVDGKASII